MSESTPTDRSLEMNLFGHLTPEQLAMVNEVRAAARRLANLAEAKAITEETVRRIQVLGFWRRLYFGLAGRLWSTIAASLHALSGLFPFLSAPAVSAAGRVLQPPALYPELYGPSTARGPSLTVVPDLAERKRSAISALARGMVALPVDPAGCLSLERTLQVEELLRRANAGTADADHIRAALARIQSGETLVETMARRP